MFCSFDLELLMCCWSNFGQPAGSTLTLTDDFVTSSPLTDIDLVFLKILADLYVVEDILFNYCIDSTSLAVVRH